MSMTTEALLDQETKDLSLAERVAKSSECWEEFESKITRYGYDREYALDIWNELSFDAQ